MFIIQHSGQTHQAKSLKWSEFWPLGWIRMIFAMVSQTTIMQTRSASSTILLILVLVITAPIWMTIGGILIGVFAGIFGALFGVFGALLGGLFALIAIPFKLIFGWCNVFDGGWIHFPGKGFFILCLIVLVVVALRKQRT